MQGRTLTRYRMLLLILAALLIATACSNRPAQQQNSDPQLPLRAVGEVPLPGDNSRFDYASLDAQRGLLFIAHLGASEVLEVDVHANQVVRTIPNISQVHGVLVVGPLNRVYATATGANQVVAIDESTGAEIGRAPTGQYPDGLAYDLRRNAIWTTNETGGTETVVDAATLQPKGTVALGGEVGNVGYDQDSDRDARRCAGSKRSRGDRPCRADRSSTGRTAVLPTSARPERRWPGQVGVCGVRPKRHSAHHRPDQVDCHGG